LTKLYRYELGVLLFSGTRCIYCTALNKASKTPQTYT